MNTYILWLLVRPVGLWALIVDGRQCISQISLHMGHSHLSLSRPGRFREKKLSNLEGKLTSFGYASWLNIEVPCYQNVLCASEEEVCHLLWHKTCQLPCTGSRSCRVMALLWMKGTHAVGTRTMLSYFRGTEEHHTQKTQKLTNLHQIFSFCFKVSGNLW